MKDTILTIESISKLRESGKIKRVVFVSGVFNILHPGHFRLLRFAKENGDFLVVGVIADKKSNDAIISETQRFQAIQSISWINFSLMIYSSLETVLKEIKPDIVVKGAEHENMECLELETLNSYGGKIIYCSGEISFSSLDLIEKEIKSTSFSSIVKPSDYLLRHKLNLNDLNKSLDDFKNTNVCIIGDSIVDEYVDCRAVGMSQEDPTLVVTPVDSQKFLGGAGIVAAHANSLGSNVRFISIIGDDSEGEFVTKKLQEFGVTSHLEIDRSRPTTKKIRYRSLEKTLLRVNNFRQHHISLEIQNSIINYLEKYVESLDLLIFSDFNYGVLPQSLVDKIIEICQKNSIFITADSQCSSQVGDISRFNNMMLITPTEREARLSVNNFESGLVVMTESLRKKAISKNIIVTLGSEGLLIHADDGNSFETDQLPAFNKMPKDPAGAGDAFLVCASIMMSKGKTIWEAAYLGSLASAHQVARVGNVPLLLSELKKELLS
jgi:rfaE bifunctional protein kinase chain/domain